MRPMPSWRRPSTRCAVTFRDACSPSLSSCPFPPDDVAYFYLHKLQHYCHISQENAINATSFNTQNIAQSFQLTGRSRVLAEERQNHILALVKAHRSISITEIQ